MNKLNTHPHYHGFFMERRGPQINHLSFIDNVIIFTSGKKSSLLLLMKTLRAYEKTSSQLINKKKSHFMVPNNAFDSTIRRIRESRFCSKARSYHLS